jgi:8-oxo-dGTP diphosphatase
MKKGVDYIGVGTGAMVFNSEGKVFLSKRGPNARNDAGKWDFPGGSVEFGETCKGAIKREIREEFGIEIEILDMIELVDHIMPEQGQHWVSPSYVARLTKGTPKIMEPKKISEIKWIDLKDIDPRGLSEASKSNLKRYIELHGMKPPG